MASTMNSTIERQIFTRDDYDALKKMQRALHDYLRLCDAADRCGQDTSGYRGIRDAQMKALEDFEREFFTPPPE